MGDSLSAAHNMPIDKSWPVIFQRKLKNVDKNFVVVNASISGETSGGGLQRLPQLLDRHQPAYLVLELGGNDGLRGYRFSQVEQNLSQMISMAIERNIRVLLVGVRLPPNLGPVYNRRFQKIFDNLAAQHRVVLLPRFLQDVAASDPELMQEDGIHPTALAQPKLAERVFEHFRAGFLK